MKLLSVIGILAAVCTTVAFVPQILKIRRQGGEDLSYPMLLLYLMGIILRLVTLMLPAAVIGANAATAVLVAIAIVLKATARHK